MPVREFADSRGVEWRVWDVWPESIYPPTREEDFLASMYLTGWLVFETKKEDDKRRLYPVPTGWSDLPVAELEALLQKAEVIPKRKLDKTLTGEARKETPDLTDLEVQRVFRYPGGRVWAIAVLKSESGRHHLLRFMTGSRHFDLADWPKEWPDYRDEQLVDLLRRAAPRKTSGAPSGDTPRRRYNDTSP